MTLRGAWKITKQTVSDFINDKVLKLSAALAYYTIFSLPGLIIIVVWVSDIFYGDKAVEGTVYGQIAGLVGKDAALQIQQTIRNATLSYETGFAATIGIATLVIGATSIFGEIQDSINTIWKLKAKPRKGWLKMIINRLLSFSIIIVLGFLLLVSLIVNAVMDALIDRLTVIFPHTEVLIAYVFNMLLSLAITSFLFGLIFKVLPDAKIEWRHVRVGAFTTAILFMAGKFGISYYLGHNRLSSAYGAAGSVIVILLWVYYSATILYFGAVFTRVYAIHKGSRIYPDDYAVWVEQVEVESGKSVQEQARDL
ncbi:YihY/virulence factor BrkB family protein [Agriterribacter sp.]|uniref:YihY/virulence factor BrkB family protein n=1 Tax=Agriterribacter sp. TaxID=2821509 RepID=UPI002CC7AFC6|nr:YihY/virulence factor BrkB family protein [Agriterribacter sp.]HRP56767.1 YihY/virulence factor BrkB family protein [Agriterribacter sp.]